MSITGHSAGGPTPAPRHWFQDVRIEVWASLAITSMWVAVAVSAVWGPDFVSTSAGGNSLTIPSGIFVTVFAWLGSWKVAKYAFPRSDDTG